MAALQITYGGSSYNVTRLDVQDNTTPSRVLLQGGQNLFANNTTRLDVQNTVSPSPTFAQNGQKLFENNTTRLDIQEIGTADRVFIQGGVASPNAQTTGAPVSIERADMGRQCSFIAASLHFSLAFEWQLCEQLGLGKVRSKID